MGFRTVMILGLLWAILFGAAPALAQDGGKECEWAVPVERGFKDHNDLLMDIHNLAPGFGGVFVSDDQTTLKVYLLDTSRLEEAKRAVEQVFGESITQGRKLEALQADFSIAQLYGWYQCMQDEVWAFAQVSMTDLDEGKNRIEIGVDELSATEGIEKALAGLGIPREAVVISVQGRPVLAAGEEEDTEPAGDAAQGKPRNLLRDLLGVFLALLRAFLLLRAG